VTHNSLVSIVLPTLNRAHYLPVSVDSVLEQTYENWELIIVDDGSDDETPEVIAHYTALDTRIKGIRHTENRTLPVALNTGFNASEGDYLTWTSDDDIFRPHAFATFVNYLNANLDVDLVYSNYRLIDADDNDIGIALVAPPNHLLYKSAVGKSFMYRRKVHEALNGYDETLFLVEDYDFWLRASQQFRLKRIKEDVYFYRRHAKSLTDTKRPTVLDLRDKLIRKHMHNMPWATKHDFALSHLHLAEVSRELGRKGQARKDWWQALRYAPDVVLRREIRRLGKRIIGNNQARQIATLYRRLSGKKL